MNDSKNTNQMNGRSVTESNARYVMLDSSQPDDDINLLDLWLVLIKRRSLFLSCLLLALIVGMTVALTMPKKYIYSTAIEVGGVAYDGQGQLIYIEKPSSVLAKINQSYIPYIIKRYSADNPEIIGFPAIKAKLEKNSNIIFIDIKGLEKYKNIYIELLNSVVNTVKQDHIRISVLKRKDLELSKKQLENKLVNLKNSGVLLLSQGKRLDKKEDLLNVRVSEMRKQLNASLKMKQSAVSSASNEGKALALMMVDTELRLTRGVLANLEEQLVIGLENKREQMQNKIAENNQQQIETNMRLGKLRVESENLLETRAITEPIRSINAVGVSKLIVVVVLLFTGVFLGIFLVFFAEFLAKVRKHQLEL